MAEQGGGASRTTEPAAGTSQATDVSLREFIEARFSALEKRLDERRTSDQVAVKIAKETADAALQAHNELIKRMEVQASESQRQMDKLTGTFSTKESLRTLETLIGQKLASLEEKARSIEAAVNSSFTEKETVRSVWSDIRSAILLGVGVLAGAIALITYLAQN